MTSVHKTNPEEIRLQAAALMERLGLPGEIRMARIPCGGNNRVYRLSLGEKEFLLKSYFRHEEDPRDRLGAEFRFLQFARDRGCRAVPAPVACDRDHLIGIYELIHGRPLRKEEISPGRIREVIDFFLYLNRDRFDEKALSLPPASEACFSLSEHIRTVDNRLERLRMIPGSDKISIEARLFVEKELTGAWHETKSDMESRARETGLDLKRRLQSSERCLSPSDFGFHNALVEDDGNLRFIDFEYAGWDDPAKMVCDFFSQPQVPVPVTFLPQFLEAVNSGLGCSGTLKNRVRLLFPLVRVKWCCIFLNDFLPIYEERTAHIAKVTDRNLQLRKATDALVALKQYKPFF